MHGSGEREREMVRGKGSKREALREGEKEREGGRQREIDRKRERGGGG